MTSLQRNHQCYPSSNSEEPSAIQNYCCRKKKHVKDLIDNKKYFPIVFGVTYSYLINLSQNDTVGDLKKGNCLGLATRKLNNYKFEGGRKTSEESWLKHLTLCTLRLNK